MVLAARATAFRHVLSRQHGTGRLCPAISAWTRPPGPRHRAPKILERSTPCCSPTGTTALTGCVRARRSPTSAASCTTNCAALMAQVLHQTFGIERGFLMTVYASATDRTLLDTPQTDLRRARSAAVNIIPTDIGAAKTLGLVLSELAGRSLRSLYGFLLRRGSLTDLTCKLSRPAANADVNSAFQAAAADGPLSDVLRYIQFPLVSRDVVGEPASCVVDASLTQADGDLVKVFGWYDAEWGYANRLVNLTEVFAAEDR